MGSFTFEKGSVLHKKSMKYVLETSILSWSICTFRCGGFRQLYQHSSDAQQVAFVQAAVLYMSCVVKC